MSNIPIKILGTGAFLPSRSMSSEELEKQLGFAPGSFSKASGVNHRYHVASHETATYMGIEAAKEALANAQMGIDDIDAVISVSGVPQQAVPTNAAFIHKGLGAEKGIAFDINATCLSFLTGLFCMSRLVLAGVYRNVLLVSSDIASAGLNPNDPKTASLFGDGAAACIIGPSEHGGIIASHFEIQSKLLDACQCQGGGTLHGLGSDIPKGLCYFRMDGPKLFKGALPPLLKMINEFQTEVGENIDLYIPHQASPHALDLLQRKLQIPDEKFVHIVKEYGNMIAASIPFALHKAIEQGRLERGDRVLLFGTGAGLTIGGVLLEY